MTLWLQTPAHSIYSVLVAELFQDKLCHWRPKTNNYGHSTDGWRQCHRHTQMLSSIDKQCYQSTLRLLFARKLDPGMIFVAYQYHHIGSPKVWLCPCDGDNGTKKPTLSLCLGCQCIICSATEASSSLHQKSTHNAWSCWWEPARRCQSLSLMEVTKMAQQTCWMECKQAYKCINCIFINASVVICFVCNCLPYVHAAQGKRSIAFLVANLWAAL